MSALLACRLARAHSLSLLLAAVLLVAPVRADDERIDPAAKAAFDDGVVAYEEGRFQAALDAYRRSYALSGKPKMLYNIGRAADSAGDLKAAASAYAAYLHSVPKGPNRAYAEGRLAVLDGRAPSATSAELTKAAQAERAAVRARAPAEITRIQAELAKKPPQAPLLEWLDGYRQLALHYQALGKDRESQAALRSLRAKYDQLPAERDDRAKERAAEAAFLLADLQDPALDDLAFVLRPPPTLTQYVADLSRVINEAGERALRRAAAFQPVLAYGAPRWSVAALERTGHSYEVLARAMSSAPFVVPTDMLQQVKKLPPESQKEVFSKVEESVREALRPKTRPFACYAITRYALAARAAKAGGIDSEHARRAREGLRLFGNELVETCITEARADDLSIAPYVKDEFARQ